MPWIEHVNQLSKKMNVLNEFVVTNEQLKDVVTKRKHWTAPGIDGTLNFSWKKFEPAQRPLARAYQRLKEDNILMPVQRPTGRTVLLPKTKDLRNEKNYRPISCFNTSCKVFKGITAKYMRPNTVVNDIWGEGQLGTVEGVLGIVDQQIIGRCIREEMKQYYRNLAVIFFDYKKAYDLIHHDWMLRVYKWIGIPTQVVHVIDQRMSIIIIIFFLIGIHSMQG